jgi:N-methylhydantoinase A
MSTAVACRVGADVGGTFTDVILQDGDGRAFITKRLSTPPSYDEAVVEAIGTLAGRAGANARVDEVVHGTTVATNAVLERRGSRTALVTTAGFRDVLELRRLRMPQMYDLFWRKPAPLVPRHMVFEVRERVYADGTIARAPVSGEVREIAGRLREAGAEAVAVCLLHSYLFPEHEREIGAILRDELPGVVVTLSSDILREQGEYERTATTAVNAYVQPLVAVYLDHIRRGLAAREIRAPVMIMQSSGGIMSAADARVRPVFALESGPAAGVVAALAISRQLGWQNVISLDMGGTTAKASLIENGAVSRGREYEAGGSLSAGSRLLRGSGELLRIPTIDIAEIGAGGGSIAWLDAGGGFQVGPRSAGAEPGPACYDRGGIEPTVTDANVVLGYMPVGPIADGQIASSAALAGAAVQRVAEPLSLSVVEGARGIYRLANARMMRALRSVSSEKGRDPRDFALLAYGGAGPIHAAGLADELGVTTVLIPPLAGFFSAVGLLFARQEFHDVRTCQLDARNCDPRVIEALYSEMERQLAGALDGRDQIDWVRTANVRYRGQGWELEVDFPAGPVDGRSIDGLRERFESEHERTYEVRGEPGSPIEIRALRLAAVGPQRPARPLNPDLEPPSVDGSTRLVHFDVGSHRTAVRTRSSVGSRPELGPMLIDEYDTTVVVPPEWSVRREGQTGTLVLERVGTPS